MSKKDNQTNQTNQTFNFPISQLQIHILRYFKMVGWIGWIGSNIQIYKKRVIHSDTHHERRHHERSQNERNHGDHIHNDRTLCPSA